MDKVYGQGLWTRFVDKKENEQLKIQLSTYNSYNLANPYYLYNLQSLKHFRKEKTNSHLITL